MGQITLGFEGRAKARRQTGPARPDRYIAPLSLFASPEAIFVPDLVPDGPIPSRARLHCRVPAWSSGQPLPEPDTINVPEGIGGIELHWRHCHISGPGLFLYRFTIASASYRRAPGS